MSKKFLKTTLFLTLFVVSTLSFYNCKTTNSLVKEVINPNPPEDATILIAPELDFPEVQTAVNEEDKGDDQAQSQSQPAEQNYKYIFLRLYNPVYKSRLYAANILKNGLVLTKTEDVPDLSHSAINFTLDDNFYGLTLGGEHQFAQEQCSAAAQNKYMRHCNPDLSEQITYALKVPEEEYYNAKKMVEFYAATPKLKYASTLNVKLGVFSLRKRFFSPKKHRKFTTQKYPLGAKNKIVKSEDEYLYRFVCSSFLAYVLYNNVSSVREFFDKYDIKYDYLNVTDLSLIPGMTPLFYSTWTDYPEAAKDFVKEYPEFAQYLPQAISTTDNQ